LNKELLDLVNENYQDFLSLGSALKGGDEKIEEVRVGLLGFERDVGLVREKAEKRRNEVRELLKEKRQAREDARIGKALLEVAERLEELEGKLMIRDETMNDNEGNGFADDLDTESDEESDGPDGPTSELAELALVSIRRLKRRVEQYLYIREMVNRIGSTHPFLARQEERILRIRNTLLLDISTALKQARQASSASHGPLLKVLHLYNDMNEEADAVMVIRGSKQ
jgi:conserved oligomeric Golgi complex subunit 2